MNLKFCFEGKKSVEKVNNFNKGIKGNYSILQEAVLRELWWSGIQMPWLKVEFNTQCSPIYHLKVNTMTSQEACVKRLIKNIFPSLIICQNLMFSRCTLWDISNYRCCYKKYAEAYHICLTWVSDHVEIIFHSSLKYSILNVFSLCK